MTRALFALLALLLTASAPADWSRRATATPNGFVLGNPAASAKLVEHASLTCPHCRAFHADSDAELKRLVATGRVSYEYRPFVLNGPDLAAFALARCDGGSQFFRRVDVLYRRQAQWTAAFGQADATARTRFEAAPPSQKLLVLAQAGGLDRFAVTALGLTPARVRQCLLDPRQNAALVAGTNAATQAGVTGTPTFFLNGARLPTNSWATIAPLLRPAPRQPR